MSSTVPALADSDDVTLLKSEGGRAVGGDVLVPLLETVVLGHVVEVVTTHDDGPLHLRGDDDAPEDTTTDADVTGEGALLVDVLALDGLLGGLEAKTDVLGETDTLALAGLGAEHAGLTDVDGRLLLESSFGLCM